MTKDRFVCFKREFMFIFRDIKRSIISLKGQRQNAEWRNHGTGTAVPCGIAIPRGTAVPQSK